MFGKTRERSPYFLAAVDFGYTLLASVLIFGGGGLWLDGKLHTSPLFVIGGLFLGLAVGFNSLFRRLNLIEEARKEAKKKEKEMPPEAKP